MIFIFSLSIWWAFFSFSLFSQWARLISALICFSLCLWRVEKGALGPCVWTWHLWVTDACLMKSKVDECSFFSIKHRAGEVASIHPHFSSELCLHRVAAWPLALRDYIRIFTRSRSWWSNIINQSFGIFLCLENSVPPAMATKELDSQQLGFRWCFHLRNNITHRAPERDRWSKGVGNWAQEVLSLSRCLGRV